MVLELIQKHKAASTSLNAQPPCAGSATSLDSLQAVIHDLQDALAKNLTCQEREMALAALANYQSLRKIILLPKFY